MAQKENIYKLNSKVYECRMVDKKFFRLTMRHCRWGGGGALKQLSPWPMHAQWRFNYWKKDFGNFIKLIKNKAELSAVNTAWWKTNEDMTAMRNEASEKHQTIEITRSSPQWWSGRLTTPHDVLNLWSPIYDPSVWDTWGSGWAHSVARPCILLAPYWHAWSISNRLAAISKRDFSTPDSGG